MPTLIGIEEHWQGLSTESKPTGRPVGTTYTELDTGAEYVLLQDRTTWQKKPFTSVDFTADIEVDGAETLNRRFNCTNIGDNTLVNVAATDQLKIYRAILTVNEDMVGEVVLKLAATELGGVYNPKAGGMYAMVLASPGYEVGELGEDLILNLPQAKLATLNVCYLTL